MRRIAPLKLAEMTAGGTWKQRAVHLGIPDHKVGPHAPQRVV
jgi:hypothetical protein